MGDQKLPSNTFVAFVVVFCSAIICGLGFLGGCWYSEGSSIGLEADTDKICVDGGLYKFAKAEAYFVHDYAQAKTFYVGQTQPIFHNRRKGDIGRVPLDKMVRLQSGEVLLEQPYDYVQDVIDRAQREHETWQRRAEENRRRLEQQRRASECPKPELPSNDKCALRDEWNVSPEMDA